MNTLDRYYLTATRAKFARAAAFNLPLDAATDEREQARETMRQAEQAHAVAAADLQRERKAGGR